MEEEQEHDEDDENDEDDEEEQQQQREEEDKEDKDEEDENQDENQDEDNIRIVYWMRIISGKCIKFTFEGFLSPLQDIPKTLPSHKSSLASLVSHHPPREHESQPHDDHDNQSGKQTVLQNVAAQCLHYCPQIGISWCRHLR